MEWIFCSVDDERVRRDAFECGVPLAMDWILFAQLEKESLLEDLQACPHV